MEPGAVQERVVRLVVETIADTREPGRRRTRVAVKL